MSTKYICDGCDTEFKSYDELQPILWSSSGLRDEYAQYADLCSVCLVNWKEVSDPHQWTRQYGTKLENMTP